MGKHTAMSRASAERVSRWLSEIDRAAAGAWIPLGSADELPPEVRADSQFWCDTHLSPEVNPHDAPGAAHAYHPATADTPDLIRHDLTVNGEAVRIVEGRNFLVIERARAGLDLRALLRAPPEAQMVSDELADGASFCSNDDVDPLLLGDAAARVDGVVQAGSLRLVCYKKPAQRVGFAKPDAWFDDELRGRG